MIRFALVLFMSLAVSSQAFAAVKWNNPSENNDASEVNAERLIKDINNPDISFGIELEPYTDTSLRKGRVELTTEKVRYGDEALKLSIQPGDCGKSWPVNENSWDDCQQGNERIGITEERKRKGIWFYTASLFLDPESFSEKLVNQTHINLMQWLDQDTKNGPPINLLWIDETTVSYLLLPQVKFPDKALAIDLRLKKFDENDPSGNQSWSPMKLVKSDMGIEKATGQWLDFVVFSNWSSENDGWFIVSLNDKVVFDYRGATLEAKSEGVVFDIQLYKYGRNDLRKKGLYPIKGGTSEILFADNIGVFKTTEKLAAKYPFLSESASFLEELVSVSAREPSRFQPPLKTNIGNVNQRYEGCISSAIC